MDPEQARRLVADEPRYEMTFGEGRSCSVCGSNVLDGDRDRHTRWHRALAEVLGLGWEDLTRRAPADPALAAAVDAVVHPRGWTRVSRLVTAHLGWRAVPDVPLGAHGTATLLLGPPGVVVVRAVGAPGERVEVRRDVVHVGGHRTSVADEVRAAVGSVRETLGARVPVVGVAVALGTLEGRDPDPPDVLAAAAPALPERLALLPEAVDPGTLDAVYDHARRSTTWAARP